MSYEVLILVFLLMVFWSFMTIFVIKAIFSVFNSVRPEETREIRFMPMRKPKKTAKDKEAEAAQRKYDTIMRNLEAYDGTGIGQEEVR